MKQIVVGIDIGGTNTPFGVITKSGDILSNETIKTKQYKTIDDFISKLAIEINTSINAIDDDVEIAGVGIGAPNGSYYNGTIEHAPNLDWKGILPVVELFRSHFDVPVYLTNDANAAALGEMYYGHAREMKNYLFVTLGTGLGSGFVNQGKLIYGQTSFAGELGHTIVEPNGRPCPCGRKGCLERYASATGLMLNAKQLIAEVKRESSLRQLNAEELNAKVISDEATKGDSLALEIFDYTAKKLALGISNAVAITNPETIFLFGGIAQAGEILLKPTRKYLNQYLLNLYKGTKLMLSGVPNDNAAILGAASLVWNELENS